MYYTVMIEIVVGEGFNRETYWEEFSGNHYGTRELARQEIVNALMDDRYAGCTFDIDERGVCMSDQLIECNHNHPDCFAWYCGGCQVLCAQIRNKECPFYKTQIEYDLGIAHRKSLIPELKM